MALNFESLVQKVNEVPLSTIVSLRVKLLQRGRHYFGVCPFHEDHTIGSFSVNDDKHIAKCFSCDNGSLDGIHFICKTDKISRKEALLRICLELGFITKAEYEKSGCEYVDWNKVNEVAKLNRIKENSTKKIANIELLNLVYTLISTEGDKLCGGDDVLSKEHRDYLHSRGITDEDIKRNGYFTMPNRRAVVKIVKKLSVFDLKNEDLQNIPGFYFNEEKKFFTLKPLKGIGIPIRNVNGLICGIQVRRDGEIKPGEQRYFWWSSGNEPLGASPGSPIDINMPKVVNNNAVFITEGHFKADAIVKKYNTPAISVQGVGNWKQIPKEIKKLPKTSSVWIAYDADMAYNKMVMDQALKLGDAIMELGGIKVYYVVWDVSLGKGFDDFIPKMNENIKPKRIAIDEFKRKCEKLNSLNLQNEEELEKEYKRIFLEK